MISEALDTRMTAFRKAIDVLERLFLAYSVEKLVFRERLD
jgi:hypothetical protein